MITVLMEFEGKPFVQAVFAAIGLFNSYASTILDLESETSNSAMQCHLQDIKELLAGNIYFSSSAKRYRQSDSDFPEQKEMSHPLAERSVFPELKGVDFVMLLVLILNMLNSMVLVSYLLSQSYSMNLALRRDLACSYLL